jgi:hypothetical protein
MIRAFLPCLVALWAAACGVSSSSPVAPTPPVDRTWTLAGQVLTTITGAPVAGATVLAGSVTATSDDGGRFELRGTGALPAPMPLTVTAPGYVERVTQATAPRTSPLVIDIIADRAPFDLAFYRALVRNGFETPDTLGPTYRWTRDARFHLQVVDDTGRAIEPEVLAVLRRELPRAFEAWTSGRYHATVEEGPDDPPNENGLVRVLFTRTAEDTCARATIGGNWGWMIYNVDRCGCGSVKVTPNVVWHEVGHTAGFRHVDGTHVMNRYYSGYCGGEIRMTDTERYHARVSYERPWGNLDPDRDPEWFFMLEPGTAARPTVACP